MSGGKNVKKIIPSRLEQGFQKFAYKHLGRLVPEKATPNQVTAFGGLCGLFAIICTLLTHLSPLFFIGTAAGLVLHHTADTLDGYAAREKNMTSSAGAYFDLITDIMFSTFFLIALGLSPYASIEVMAFAAPVYGIINVTAMNYIIYFNEFLFPRLGPIEAHLVYIAAVLLAMLAGNRVLTFSGVTLHPADIIMIPGIIAMYCEMLRLQTGLFKRLQQEE